jgi:hypothetical protein
MVSYGRFMVPVWCGKLPINAKETGIKTPQKPKIHHKCLNPWTNAEVQADFRQSAKIET